jgi:hypothetical protein
VATALVHGRVGIAEVDGLSGRSITVEATDPIGSPQNRSPTPSFEAKFRDCAKNAVRPLFRCERGSSSSFIVATFC